MKKKQKERTEDTFTSTGAKPLLTPTDVQQKEFHVSRMGGYKMRDVDEFLDEITTSMSATLEENRRLKERMGSGAMMGAPDLEEVGRQADEIIRRAREEAAQIVRDATAGAAAAAQGSAAAGGTGERAAISPFLLREREFLQGLAALVQGHAEAVKTMAKDVRARADASVPASPAPAVPPLPVSVPEPEVPEPEPAPAAQTSPAPEPPASVGPPTEAMEEPVRIEEAEPEPEPANIGRADADDAAAGEGDRSLRELFWGED
jgi:DivIVA domain-containing protein